MRAKFKSGAKRTKAQREDWPSGPLSFLEGSWGEVSELTGPDEVEHARVQGELAQQGCGFSQIQYFSSYKWTRDRILDAYTQNHSKSGLLVPSYCEDTYTGQSGSVITEQKKSTSSPFLGSPRQGPT